MLDHIRHATLVGICLTLVPVSHAIGQTVAFERVNVIAMDRAVVLPLQTVVVEGGTIVWVEQSDQAEIPQDAQRIDGTGKFLIPGLHDMHIHLGRDRRNAEQMLRMYLGLGVTTVAVLNGHPLVRELQRDIADGIIEGPNIVSSGPTLRRGPPNTHAEGEAVVREQVAAGYDLIKVYNGLPAAAYRGIMTEAQRLGVQVIGHAVRAVGIDGAIEEGQHIAHMEEVVYGYFRRQRVSSDGGVSGRKTLAEQLDSTLIPELANRIQEAGVWVIPNLVAYHWIERQVADIQRALDRPEIQLLPPETQNDWSAANNRYLRVRNQERFLETLSTTFPFLQMLTRQFQKSGVRLLAGSDAPVPVTVPGYGLHEELQELVDAGLTPFQALTAATTAPATFLDRSAGRIAVGSVADLVLLDANPLADIDASRAIVGVMKSGKWFGPDAFTDVRIRQNIN